jgi:hypothetical protein
MNQLVKSKQRKKITNKVHAYSSIRHFGKLIKDLIFIFCKMLTFKSILRQKIHKLLLTES